MQATISRHATGGNNDIWTKRQENVYFGDVTINRPVAVGWGVLRGLSPIIPPQHQRHLFSNVVKAVKCAQLAIPNSIYSPLPLPWTLNLNYII